MAIDLNKYGSEMLKAFNDVISGKNNTDWALYGYEGQTNVLKLIGTGDGGLEELADDLSSSRIMYAILRVTDPKTTRQKVVLINWQGEGAPSLRKGTSASHLPALHTFFKGIHVTVSARTEDEVELSTVMAAVQKASATEYDFAQRTDDVNERTAPVKGLVYQFRNGDVLGSVGTNYKRTNPLAEIDSNRRNKFWEQMEAAETERKEEELRRRELEHKAEEAERKKREIASTHEREVRTKERNARIVAEHKAESEAELRLIAASTRVRKDSDLHNGAREVDDDEAERAQRAEKLRAERKKEAEALAGHRAHEARALFEGGGGRSPNSAWKQEDVRVGVSSGSGRPPSKVLKEFSPISNRSDVTNYSSNNSSPSITPGKMSSRWPPGGASISPVPAEVASGRAQQRGSAFGTSGQVRELSGSTFGTPNQVIPQHSSPPPPPLKQHRDSDITSDGMKNTIGHIRNILNDSDKHNNTNESNFHSGNETTELQSVKQNGLKNGQKTSYSNITIQDTANCVVEQVLSQVSSQVSSSQVLSRTKKTELVTSNSVQDQGLGLAVEAVTCEVDGIEYQILPEHGLCARAVYDYQAADDTEITFNPSEIITNIDQIDEGWWQGLGPDGNYGLFPANYVELINPAVLL